jgi:hypothetical protein
MSDIEELVLEIGCIVELKDGFQRIYPLSFPGAQAKIVDYTIDPEGFERVLIEWDRKHYRYNGERNNWTYASHFRVISPAPKLVPPKADSAPTGEPRFESPRQDGEWSDPGRDILAYLNKERAKQEVPEPPVQKQMSVDRYAEIMSSAFEAVQEGAGFVIFTYSPNKGGHLIPFLFSASVDPEATVMLKEAVVRVGMQFIAESEGDDE